MSNDPLSVLKQQYYQVMRCQFCHRSAREHRDDFFIAVGLARSLEALGVTRAALAEIDEKARRDVEAGQRYKTNVQAPSVYNGLAAV